MRLLFVLSGAVTGVGVVFWLLGALFVLAGDDAQKVVGAVLIAGMTAFLMMTITIPLEMREALRREKRKGWFD